MLKKNKIGPYEIQYDTVIDHDVFAFLRVSLEVPRGQNECAHVLLNGQEVGIIRVVKDGRKVRFAAARLRDGMEVPLSYFEPSKEIGKAAAAIISDFVK